MAFPVDESFIRKTEAAIGASFPASYVNAMVADNGGSIRTGSDQWSLYPIFDTSDKKRLKRTCNDVVRQTRSAMQWTGFPEDAVAIGGNGSGDQLIFLKRGEQLGPEVHWWDHETGKVHPITDDFGKLTKRRG
ncbi:MAG: SMI1/KNR4 family protein [Phycisphaeraceae bacterium]|nr:SMI1/KNR4 family protein [Phycisphaeraceae bacterium]